MSQTTRIPDPASLRQQVVSGVAWASATRIAGQVLNWGITLFVIRILRPSDYGLMAITMALIGFLQVLSSGGFADALVQAKDLDETAIRKSFGTIILINAVLLAIVFVAAPAAAQFYAAPALVPLLRVSSLSFVLIALAALSRAALDRALALKHTSRIELLGNLSAGLATISLAVTGFGVWSLVAGNLLNQAVRAAGYYCLAPHRSLPIFSLRGNGRILRFGLLRSAENLVWYLSTQIDILIVARLLGAEALGIYTVARTIAAMPITQIASVVKPISFSAFARLQSDPALATEYLGKAMRILAFISFPVFFGLSAVAPELTAVVLGAKWISAALPLSILALGMTLRPTGIAIPSYLQGMGAVRTSLVNTVLTTTLFVVAYAIGSFWGVLGICIGGAAGNLGQFALLVSRVSVIRARSVEALLRPLLRPFLCATLMFAAVSTGQGAFGGLLSPVYALLLLVGTGVMVYTIASLGFSRPLLREMYALASRRG